MKLFILIFYLKIFVRSRTLPPMNQRHIFFIDDNTDDQFLFSEALVRLSARINCTFAQDAESALQLLTEPDTKLPELIFLDLNMPRMNGKECLRQLKGQPALKDIPVVVFTTSTSEEEKAISLQLGASAFVTKPNTFDQLKESISNTLQQYLSRN